MTAILVWAIALLFVWRRLYRTDMELPETVEKVGIVWPGWERWTPPTIYEIRDYN